MDFGGFIGRFHPLLVHLPIGLLLLAAIFQYFARKPKYKKLDNAIAFTLAVGAVFAILSSVSGWLLANRGAYIERSLFLHRWLGIGVAILATLCWLIKTNRLKTGKGLFNGLVIFMILAIFATGHFGGNMTHGDDYLTEYTPAFVKNIFHKKDTAVSYQFGKTADIKVYDELVRPMLENECWKCHNPDNPLGGLDMSTKTAFTKGGLSGALVENGDAYASLLFERIVLPVSDRKAMPPAGLPLSYNEIRLIEWWINSGASFEKKLGAFELPSDIKNLLQKEYEISFLEKSLIESLEVSPAPQTEIDALVEKGVDIKAVSKNSNLLEVTLSDSEKLELLQGLKEQITWLNTNGADISDTAMTSIASFVNLTRLRLNNNPVTDRGLKEIETLPVLESLNLVNTKISDKALNSIKKMPSLKTLYLWQTEISEEAIEQLKAENPELEIIKDFQFETAPSE